MIKYFPGEKIKYNRNGDRGIIINFEENYYPPNRYKIRANFGEFWIDECNLDVLNSIKDE